MTNAQGSATNAVHMMDCFEGMEQLLRDRGEGCVNLILTDLPYGTTDVKGWDKKLPMDRLWDFYNRLLAEDGTIALFGSQPFSSYLVASNPEMFRYEWIWDKNRGANFLNANCQPLKVHENILIFTKLPTSPNKRGNAKYHPQRIGTETRTVKSGKRGGRGNINGGSFEQVESQVIGRHPTSILNYSKDGTLHPAQKPVGLCEFMIRSYTDDNDLVLDNCMGSGSTAIAAINTRRNFIGYEIDPDFYEVCQKRIDEHRGATTDEMPGMSERNDLD